MTLGFSFRASESSWSAPATIVSAAGIISTTVAQLPDGRWIAGWVEVDQAGLSNPFAPTTIKTAVSTDATGQTWPVPDQDVVAALDNARARQLQFLIGTNLVGLSFLQSTGTPTSTMASVMGATWDGNDWSALTTLVAETRILAFGAMGSGVSGPDSSQLIYVEDQTVKAFEWTGGAPGAPVILNTDANNVIDIHADQNGTFYAAYGLSESGIGLSKFDTVWSDLGTQSATAIPSEIEVAVLTDDVDPTVVSIVWSSGGGPCDISYLFTDTTGTVLQEDTALTSNSVGRYHGLQLIAEQVDLKAILLTLFTASPDELRRFNLGFNEGIADNDSDGDGMNDIGELLIVDDIPDDGQFDTIESVLPASDYDLDGVDNAMEIMAGTDPTNPLEFPESPGVIITSPIAEASELTLAPGRFTVSRPSDDIEQELSVDLLYTGTATSNVDYVLPPTTSVVIPENATSASIAIEPIGDNEPEGDETVRLTIVENPAYTIGSPDEALVTIKDIPIDDWRTQEFADPNSLEAQDQADGDDDGIPTILEFALFLDPDVSDTIELPDISTEMDQFSGEDHLTLTYTRRITDDLIFTVEVTDDLEGGIWQSNTDGSGEIVTEEVMRVDNGNGTETVETRSVMTVPEDNSFFMRLKVSR